MRLDGRRKKGPTIEKQQDRQKPELGFFLQVNVTGSRECHVHYHHRLPDVTVASSKVYQGDN